MRPWLRVGSWLAAAISLFYFSLVARQGFHQFGELELVPSWTMFGAAALLGFSWILMFEIYWARILHECVGALVPARATVRWIFAKSYIARYAPGKVWPLIIRTADFGVHGIHWRATLRATLMEQIGFMLGSAFVLLGMIVLLYAMLAKASTHTIALGAILYVLLSWLTVRLIAGDAVAAMFSNQLKRLAQRISPGSTAGIRFPSRREWGRAVFLGTLLALAQSFSALPLVLEFAPDDGPLVLLVACLAYPSARWIGQLVGVSPGGLGVREGAFVALLAPILPASTALLIALWLRAATILAEVSFLGAAAVAMLAKRDPNR